MRLLLNVAEILCSSYLVIYRKLGVTDGMSANVHATYVYPSALKAVVRARFPDTVKDWEDPVGKEVYHVVERA